MIELFTWNTPNGRKVAIALEELGEPYRVSPIDIGNDEQFTPEYLSISPNNKIPAIIDHDSGMSLMDSGAILIYLADRFGKLLPKNGEPRYRAIEWLTWQLGGVGTIFGQYNYYYKFNKGKHPAAQERLMNEVLRLYRVLDKRLEGREFLADEYSIADIAVWPWVSRFDWQDVSLEEYPNIRRWYTDIAVRPAVQKGYKVPQDVGEIPMP